MTTPTRERTKVGEKVRQVGLTTPGTVTRLEGPWIWVLWDDGAEGRYTEWNIETQ